METKNILFRGLNENDEWVYGFYKNISDPDNAFYRVRGYIYPKDGGACLVKSGTVCQWSGMYDHSSPQQKIFENDILTVDDPTDVKLYRVIFRDGCFMVVPLYAKNTKGAYPLFIFFKMHYKKRIIVVDDLYSWADRINKFIKPVSDKIAPYLNSTDIYDKEDNYYTEESYVAIINNEKYEFPTLDEYIDFLIDME